MRLFLALELPPHARAAVASLANRLMERWEGWRWVRPESVHLTLRFLGEVEPAREAAARASWKRAAASARPFSFQLRGLGLFPDARRPRVLCVGVRELDPGDRLAHLAQDVEQAARQIGFEPEPRPFRPHLTLARARPGRRAGCPELPDFELAEPIAASELVLFESHLGPSGARHMPLERFSLGPAVALAEPERDCRPPSNGSARPG